MRWSEYKTGESMIYFCDVNWVSEGRAYLISDSFEEARTKFSEGVYDGVIEVQEDIYTFEIPTIVTAFVKSDIVNIGEEIKAAILKKDVAKARLLFFEFESIVNPVDPDRDGVEL